MKEEYTPHIFTGTGYEVVQYREWYKERCREKKKMVCRYDGMELGSTEIQRKKSVELQNQIRSCDPWYVARCDTKIGGKRDEGMKTRKMQKTMNKAEKAGIKEKFIQSMPKR